MSEPTFRDAGEDVVVELPVPSGMAAEDVRVSGGADALVIRTSDAAAPLLSVVQVYSTVDPAATRVEVPTDGTLRITLRKLDPDLAWPGLHAQDAPQVSSTPRGAARRRRLRPSAVHGCISTASKLRHMSSILRQFSSVKFRFASHLRRKHRPWALTVQRQMAEGTPAGRWRSAPRSSRCCRPARMAIWMRARSALSLLGRQTCRCQLCKASLKFLLAPDDTLTQLWRCYKPRSRCACACNVKCYQRRVQAVTSLADCMPAGSSWGFRQRGGAERQRRRRAVRAALRRAARP